MRNSRTRMRTRLAPCRFLPVFAAPLMVAVLEAAVRTEPPPDVSQFPATVHEPDAVIVPEVPPVITTLVTLTADVPAVKVAPLFTVRFPPGPVKARFAVERVALLLRVNVPPQRSPFVAMVNVAAAVGLNCTLLNSETPKLAKVIVRDEPELKTTVPVPTDHDPLVDEVVHEPAKFQTPVIVTVLVPFVNTEPAPLVSQLPVLVNELVVSVIVPLVPPVISTLNTVTVDAFAVRMPPLPTLSAPPVRPRLAVASAVVEVPSEIVSVPPQISALVAMVNVWADAADEVNEMSLNSLPGRFVPANVIVPPVALVNVTVPVPGIHEADVDAFVQVPVTVQVDVPMAT